MCTPSAALVTAVLLLSCAYASSAQFPAKPPSAKPQRSRGPNDSDDSGAPLRRPASAKSTRSTLKLELRAGAIRVADNVLLDGLAPELRGSASSGGGD